MVVVNGHSYIDLAYGTTPDQQTCDVKWHVENLQQMLKYGGAPTSEFWEILDAIHEHLPEGGE